VQKYDYDLEKIYDELKKEKDSFFNIVVNNFQLYESLYLDNGGKSLREFYEEEKAKQFYREGEDTDDIDYHTYDNYEKAIMNFACKLKDLQGIEVGEIDLME
jgi:hypothetical protein